jgi:hypothetical protein
MHLPNLERALKARFTSIAEYISLTNFGEEQTGFHWGSWFVESISQCRGDITTVTLSRGNRRLLLSLTAGPAGHAAFNPRGVWVGVPGSATVIYDKPTLERICLAIDQEKN